MKTFKNRIFISALIGLTLFMTSCFNLQNNKSSAPAENKTEKKMAVSEEDAPEAPPKTAEYTEIINEIISNQNADCYYGFHIYQEDYQFQTPSEKVPSASVIKVFIMEYAFHCIAQDKLSMDTVIDGSTLENLLEAMITYSDNSATNTLISYFTMDELNRFFADSGYSDTVIERKMLDFQAQNAGKDNYTSISDVMKFLDKLYQGKDNFPYREMLDIMKRQQVKTKIQRDLPNGVVVANKTGELSDVENDIGIVFTPEGDFAIAFLNCNVKNPAKVRNAIAKATLSVYEKVIENREKEL